MKLKKIKKIKKNIIITGILVIMLFIISYSLSFIVDTYFIPVANEASLAQLNGGDIEYLEMRTTKKLIETFQAIIIPVASILSLITIMCSLFLIFKKEDKV